jgi:hypothetical protein
MDNTVWELTESVETDATLEFVWNYWTNVANWDDPPAKFELDGPFAAGSHGITRLPAQEPLRWLIRAVSPPNTATIELELNGAVLSFEWRFEPVTNDRTRLTQRVVLQGENTAELQPQLESTFTSTVPAGMKKLATTIGEAAASSRNPSDF